MRIFENIDTDIAQFFYLTVAVKYEPMYQMTQLIFLTIHVAHCIQTTSKFKDFIVKKCKNFLSIAVMLDTYENVLSTII